MKPITDIPKELFRVVVAGDRNCTDYQIIYNELLALGSGCAIIHGACRGVDLVADKAARDIGLLPVGVPAHWQHNDSVWIQYYGSCPADCQEVSGPQAGPIRNVFMLDTFKPDMFIAFHANIGASRGTRNCLQQARRRGIPGKLVGANGVIVERW